MPEYEFLTEKEDIERIKENYFNIMFIDNPTEEMQLLAVAKNGNALNYIDKPTILAQVTAVKQTGEALRFVKDFQGVLALMTQDELVKAIKQNQAVPNKFDLNLIKDPCYRTLIKLLAKI